MGVREHPARGSVVTVDYSSGFKPPEMVKRRLAIVLSPKIAARPNLCTVVPLSLAPPMPAMPYHAAIRIPFELSEHWGDHERWIKGDMINAVALHRIDLIRLGKNRDGKRIYQMQVLPKDLLMVAQKCVLHGIGMSTLTKYL
jgi:mRNA interferase MazF